MTDVRLISEKRLKSILQKFEQLAPILVIGDVGIDKYTYGEVRRISPEAPVPILEVTKEWKKLGLTANVSDNLIGLKVSNTLCGVIGNDAKAGEFEHIVEESGLQTWGIIRHEGSSTTVKERVVTKTQQICRIDYEDKSSINKEMEDRVFQRVTKFFDQHQSIILQDYNKGLLTEALCQRLIPLFKNAGKNIYVDPHRNKNAIIYKGATLLKPNLVEAYLLAESLGYKNESLKHVANILIDKLELKKIIITLGSEGMAYLDTELDKDLHIIPTVARKVFDVSGAGDTVISLVASCLEAGSTLEEAAWVGNCGAGVVVAKTGTARVSQEELVEYYQSIHEELSHGSNL